MNGIIASACSIALLNSAMPSFLLGMHEITALSSIFETQMNSVGIDLLFSVFIIRSNASAYGPVETNDEINAL